MRATLITIVGPQLNSELTGSVPRILATDLDSDAELIDSQPPHAAELGGLEVRQWRTRLSREAARAALTDITHTAQRTGVDVLVTPAALLDPGPRLVVTDVDSTLIQDEVIELLADHAGSRAAVTEVTEAAMRGELDFAQSLLQRVATLRGLPVAVHDQVLQATRLSAGVDNLCRVLKRNGDYIGVVSGGFIEIVQVLADRLGIDFARANRLTVVDGHLSGEVTGVIVDRAVKAQTLQEWATQIAVPLERTIAVGDGANDLEMLATAGLGIAFNAKPIVQKQADAAITGARLDALLAVIGR